MSEWFSFITIDRTPVAVSAPRKNQKISNWIERMSGIVRCEKSAIAIAFWLRPAT